MRFFAANRERKSELTFVLVLLGVLFLSLGLAEAVLRSQGVLISGPLDEDFDWARFRDEVGVSDDQLSTYGFLPNSTFGDIEINARGNRGPDVELPKPKERTRLAVLGTSTILGPGLPQDQTIPAQMVRILNEQASECSFDYVSISGPAYGFDDLRQLFGRLPPALDIDAIVLVHPGYSPSLERLQRATADAERPDPIAGEHLPLLGKLKLYWQLRNYTPYWRASGRSSPGEAVAQEVQALERLLATFGTTGVFYFESFAKNRQAEAGTRALWRTASAQVFDGATSLSYSTALQAIAPVPTNYLSGSHYSAQGARQAAERIASVLAASPEFESATCR